MKLGALPMAGLKMPVPEGKRSMPEMASQEMFAALLRTDGSSLASDRSGELATPRQFDGKRSLQMETSDGWSGEPSETGPYEFGNEHQSLETASGLPSAPWPANVEKTDNAPRVPDFEQRTVVSYGEDITPASIPGALELPAILTPVMQHQPGGERQSRPQLDVSGAAVAQPRLASPATRSDGVAANGKPLETSSLKSEFANVDAETKPLTIRAPVRPVAAAGASATQPVAPTVGPAAPAGSTPLPMPAPVPALAPAASADPVVMAANSPAMQIAAEVEAQSGTIRMASNAAFVPSGGVVHKLSVDLYPAHLGRVVVAVTKTPAGLTATLVTETQMAAQALAQETDTLMQVLRAAGVTEVTVSTAGQPAGSGTSFGQTNGQGDSAGHAARDNGGHRNAQADQASEDGHSDGAVRHSDSPARTGLVI